jgi:uncharacterized protein GlcG (DUF336 family)
VLVNASGTERHSPQAGAAGLTQAEVTRVLSEALGIANRTRAQIRQPVGSPAEVTVSVVDADGTLLGLARTPDAPVFGTDVSLQKARTAAFFSSSGAASLLLALPPANYAGVSISNASLADYLSGPGGARAFFNNDSIFADGRAFSARAIGNIARPNFPDGIDANPRGPLSKSLAAFSPFNVGFQLDLIYNGLVEALLNPDTANDNCTTTAAAGSAVTQALKNGIQIFPGGIPIYRNDTLVGAIGISGDGVDQDDMIAFLGLDEASKIGTGIGNAPSALRADNLAPMGRNLRYVQCPQSPFNNSTLANVCNGK